MWIGCGRIVVWTRCPKRNASAALRRRPRPIEPERDRYAELIRRALTRRRRAARRARSPPTGLLLCAGVDARADGTDARRAARPPRRGSSPARARAIRTAIEHQLKAERAEPRRNRRVLRERVGGRRSAGLCVLGCLGPTAHRTRARKKSARRSFWLRERPWTVLANATKRSSGCCGNRSKTPQRGGVTDACLDAETLAAWTDGGLVRPALEAVQLHVADCARCQDLAGTLARISSAVPQAEPVPSVAALARVVRPARGRGAPPWRSGLRSPAIPARLRPSPAAHQSRSAAGVGVRSPFRDRPPTAAGRTGASAARRTPARRNRRRRASATGRRGPEEKRAIEHAASTRRRNENRGERRGRRAAISPQTRSDKKVDALPATGSARGSRRRGYAGGSFQPAGTRRAPGATGPSRRRRGRARDRFARPRGPLADSGDGRAALLQRRIDVGNGPRSASPPNSTAGVAPSATVCWLVGRNGVVLLTTDGRTWRRLPFPEMTDLSAVRTVDAGGRVASVSTADGRTFVTTDAGVTWSPANAQRSAGL